MAALFFLCLLYPSSRTLRNMKDMVGGVDGVVVDVVVFLCLVHDFCVEGREYEKRLNERRCVQRRVEFLS